jgi:hypothetical protein
MPRATSAGTAYPLYLCSISCSTSDILPSASSFDMYTFPHLGQADIVSYVYPIYERTTFFGAKSTPDLQHFNTLDPASPTVIPPGRPAYGDSRR